MILRRMAEAIRTQNWFTVFIEILIVVLGVVIGIQVSNWNDERKIKQDLRASLESLQVESEFVIGYFDRQISYYDVCNQRRSEALRRLVAKDWEGANRGELIYGISCVSLYPAATPPSAAFKELTASGRLAFIQPDAIKTAIMDYDEELTFLRGQIDYFRRDVPRLYEVNGIDLEFTPETSRQRLWVMDLELLDDNQDFINLMLAANNRMRGLTGWWKDTRQAAFVLCEQVSLEVGRNCNPKSREDAR